MSYSQVQCIGYVINTFPARVTGGYGKQYLGKSAKPDIRQRCHILREAIRIAEGSSELRKGNHVLKVFMAPEFFFHDKNGAYPIEHVSSIMENMREYTKQFAFRDWIFVYGTAVAYLEEGSSKEVFNIALVQRGGTEETGPDAALIVYKEFVSHVDFVRSPVLEGKIRCPNCNALVSHDTAGYEGWERTTRRRALIGGPTDSMSLLRPTEGSRDTLSRHEERVGPGREQTITGLGGQGAFTMHGVHFGLEVCLDHSRGRLRASPPPSGTPYPQIHLIPSGGMTIKDRAIACQQWGIVFNVDAGHVAVTRNAGYYSTPRGEDRDVDARGNDVAGSRNPLDTIAVNLAGVAPTWNSFFKNQGVIAIFPTLKIPAPEIRRT